VIALVWQFQVKREREREFEDVCGADGPWAALSRRSRSFLGSSFLRDLAQPGRYFLIEYWSEMLVYERHQADFGDEIRQLERERAELLDGATPLGIFSALNVPDRTGPTWSRRSGKAASPPEGKEHD
jgi:quinol monooxygenase YgiN